MSAALPLTMAPGTSPKATTQSDKATGFFTLPRELRDRIYELVRDDRCQKVKLVRFEIRAAIPEKRLVSRQFKFEYDQRSAVNTFVHVFDICDKCIFEDFPRLALDACYLSFNWLSAFDDEDGMPMLLSLGARVGLPLEARLKFLEESTSHFPKVKDVHIELIHLTTHDLRDVVNDLIACPVLTSFTVKNHRIPAKGVDFAIWSREHGFLVDNTDKEKAEQTLKAAFEFQSGRVAEEL